MSAVVDATRLFGLGEPTEAPLFAARGAMGEVHLATTSGGRYAIKRLYEWNDGAGAEAEATFTARARERGVITPVDVRSPTGSLIVTASDQRFRAFGWLDLDQPRRPPLGVALLREVGRLVAQLHQASEPTEQAVDDCYLVPPADHAWEELALRAEVSGRPWARTLRRRLPELRQISQSFARAPKVPAWTCHRDLSLRNVLPLTSGGLAFLTGRTWVQWPSSTNSATSCSLGPLHSTTTSASAYGPFETPTPSQAVATRRLSCTVLPRPGSRC